ncbi:exosortase [Alteromonas sp. ALT199]|uniref:exosortase A n=1 Tax=unclassified Alteromonas TaxID=2614992 RepID=UPI001BEA4758|nr:exosortase A [Alteromonas sp. ALT199]MBT3135655.1 exosortase [Alteromonas sp. ALT199]
MDNGGEQNNKQQNLADFSFAKNRDLYVSSFLLLFLWLVFCWQGLTTAVEIWYGNEIFNHCFFIVPGALYLIYLKRYELLAQPIRTSVLALIIVIPALLLYVFGVAGDIQLFLHAATFTLLPALIWLLIGTQAAKTILFPLVFMLFSIPVGEQLIPYLQEIAADGSVVLLRSTGVPLFRSGLYIEIPQGRFLVAEACSGVSFFIASFVIGSLYAYLNLVSIKRRAVFVAISLIFPVLANIVRVYGIILIAYWTDMEHAAGADHLIYGWFFFAFVIVCLLGIGELMREQATPKLNLILLAPTVAVKRSVVFVAVIACSLAVLWVANISNLENNAFPSPSLSGVTTDKCKQSVWTPLIQNPDMEEKAFVEGTNCMVKVHTAWFSEKDNELVSDLHRVFDPERFSLRGTRTLNIEQYNFVVYDVVSLSGKTLSIVKWYEIEGTVFTNAIQAKLRQTVNVLAGKNSGGRLWVVMSEDDDLKLLVQTFVQLQH